MEQYYNKCIYVCYVHNIMYVYIWYLQLQSYTITVISLQITCPINGQPTQVGKFSHSLRTHLFKYVQLHNHEYAVSYITILLCYHREHLGLLDNEHGNEIVADPVIRHFYEGRWMNTAVRNTIRLQRAFGGKCIPTDDVRNFAELAEFRVRLYTVYSILYYYIGQWKVIGIVVFM